MDDPSPSISLIFDVIPKFCKSYMAMKIEICLYTTTVIYDCHCHLRFFAIAI